jgi:hypothetical protein
MKRRLAWAADSAIPVLGSCRGLPEVAKGLAPVGSKEPSPPARDGESGGLQSLGAGQRDASYRSALPAWPASSGAGSAGVVRRGTVEEGSGGEEAQDQNPATAPECDASGFRRWIPGDGRSVATGLRGGQEESGGAPARRGAESPARFHSRFILLPPAVERAAWRPAGEEPGEAGAGSAGARVAGIRGEWLSGSRGSRSPGGGLWVGPGPISAVTVPPGEAVRGLRLTEAETGQAWLCMDGPAWSRMDPSTGREVHVYDLVVGAQESGLREGRYRLWVWGEGDWALEEASVVLPWTVARPAWAYPPEMGDRVPPWGRAR